jgi:pantoate--beta-alanine ligase
MALCLIGLGSNQGDRIGNLLAAVAAVRNLAAVRLNRVSSFHETAPVGGPAGQANFFNAAAVIDTQLSPAALLEALIGIEKSLGRVRSERWGPRTIDLDLLLCGEEVIETPQLTVPHPQMAERRFVLAPASEIAAHWRHPLLGRTIEQMLAVLPAAESGEPRMRVIASPLEIQSELQKIREEGKRISVVPTMGALHDGHLSLVRTARRQSDVVVATIFVNPTQFGPHEDFGRYPRTLDADLSALSRERCDLVFIPTTGDMYPTGFSTYVEPPAVAGSFEGVCRPGHFRGVATVVLKLFHLIPAHVAFFGQKDFQQLLVIRHMVRDLAVPIEIVSCPTIREGDGLALSSRNRYLSPAERERALAISRALERAEALVGSGQRDTRAIVGQMRDVLTAAGIDRIDYVALADPETLVERPHVDGPTVALIAAYVGTTRLIDNRVLNL